MVGLDFYGFSDLKQPTSVLTFTSPKRAIKIHEGCLLGFTYIYFGVLHIISDNSWSLVPLTALVGRSWLRAKDTKSKRYPFVAQTTKTIYNQFV